MDITSSTTSPSPMRDYSVSRRLLIIPAVLLLTSLLFIYKDDLGLMIQYSNPVVRSYWPADTPFDEPPPLKASEDADLNRVLKEAGTENKTIIMTTLNAAWANNGSIMDIFLESFRTGDGTKELLDHLVIVAFDQKAYQMCKSVHRHCFALRTEGVDFSAQKDFLTEDYFKMMWRRIGFLVMVIRKDYNVIFTSSSPSSFHFRKHHHPLPPPPCSTVVTPSSWTCVGSCFNRRAPPLLLSTSTCRSRRPLPGHHHCCQVCSYISPPRLPTHLPLSCVTAFLFTSCAAAVTTSAIVASSAAALSTV